MLRAPLNKGANLFRNPHCLSTGTDSLYLLLMPTFWATNYPHKHTSCTISRQKRHFPILLCQIQRTSVLLKLSDFIYAEFFTSSGKILCWQAHLMIWLQLVALV